MILCICNNITDKEVKEAIDNGCKTVKDVCIHVGLCVECGTCLKLISEEIKNEHRRTNK